MVQGGFAAVSTPQFVHTCTHYEACEVARWMLAIIYWCALKDCEQRNSVP